MGEILCYKRVSTVDQNLDRQLPGLACDREFVEKISGKDMNRPALQRLLEHVRVDDVVHVHELSRLGRSVRDLLEIVETIVSKGATIFFHKENLTFGGGKGDPFLAIEAADASSFGADPQVALPVLQKGEHLIDGQAVGGGEAGEATAVETTNAPSPVAKPQQASPVTPNRGNEVGQAVPDAQAVPQALAETGTDGGGYTRTGWGPIDAEVVGKEGLPLGGKGGAQPHQGLLPGGYGAGHVTA